MTRPGIGPRPARPATWASSWKVRSRRQVVRQVEGHVGGDDRGQRHGRQVEALGRQLRADQDVDAAVAQVVVDRLEAAPRGQRVRIESGDPEVREGAAQLGLDPLGARAEVADPAGAAVRAAFRRRRRAAAVVAAELLAGGVVDERQVAVRAAQALAAVAAQDESGGTAPVDEQDRLLGPGPQGRERSVQRPREDRAVTLRQLIAQVDQLDRAAPGRRAVRAARCARPGRHVPVPAVTTSGRGGAEHDAAAAQGGATARHPARVVARGAIGLEAGVVRLVNDQQHRTGERREDRGPGADHHARLAPQDPPPLVVALARRQARVQHRQVVAEQGVQPVRQLRDQRHLRHQHDRSLATLQGGVDGRHVDVRLARRRHALQQQLSARRQRLDGSQRGPLLVGQVMGRWSRRRPMGQRVPLEVAPVELSRRRSPPAAEPVPAATRHRPPAPPPARATFARRPSPPPAAPAGPGRPCGEGAVRPRAQHAHTACGDFRRSKLPARTNRAAATQAFQPLLATAFRRQAHQGRIGHDPILADKASSPSGRRRVRADLPAPIQPRLQPGRQHGGQGGADRRPVVRRDLLRQGERLRRQHRRRDHRFDVAQFLAGSSSSGAPSIR